MATFKIEGGNRLQGDLHPQGAKNEALQVICAVLLTSEEVKISNIPEISDVIKLIEILTQLGVKTNRTGKGNYTFQADEIKLDYLKTEKFARQAASLRGSIMILGPLLARFGVGYIPQPGGDKIGRRRLDTHFTGLQKLGANFKYNPEEHFYSVEASKLKGTYMVNVGNNSNVSNLLHRFQK